MFTGIYCSNMGLNAMQEKMQCVANNTANCNTEGFKQGSISFKPFLEERYGVMVNQVGTDFSAGTPRETDNPTHFAIQGDGFFKLDTSQGTRYTRSGAFQTDKDGYLVDKNGSKVLGKTGDVKLVNGKPDQEFDLASFQNQQYLVPTVLGFSDGGQAGMPPTDNVQVKQGFLEDSNVNLLLNMTDMITTAREFAMNSRMLMTQDEMLKQAAEEIGTVR